MNIKKINRYCQLFDKKYSVNKGGCGYLAKFIADKLLERQVEYKIGVQGTCSIGSNDFLKRKMCKGDCSMCCWVDNYHVFIDTEMGSINKAKNKSVLFFTETNKNVDEIIKAMKWREDFNPKNNIFIFKKINKII